MFCCCCCCCCWTTKKWKVTWHLYFDAHVTLLTCEAKWPVAYYLLLLLLSLSFYSSFSFPFSLSLSFFLLFVLPLSISLLLSLSLSLSNTLFLYLTLYISFCISLTLTISFFLPFFLSFFLSFFLWFFMSFVCTYVSSSFSAIHNWCPFLRIFQRYLSVQASTLSRLQLQPTTSNTNNKFRETFQFSRNWPNSNINNINNKNNRWNNNSNNESVISQNSSKCRHKKCWQEPILKQKYVSTKDKLCFPSSKGVLLQLLQLRF